MNDKKFPAPSRRMRMLLGKLAILWAGIIVGQFILYGPSLIGRKILLPLDILALHNVYLPATPEFANITVHDRVQSDLVYLCEPARRFAMSEIHAGRFPMWASYQYAGSPFIWPKYSPFFLLSCCTASPVIIAWTQLFAALVAGTGAYLFFRRALAVSFWPATICAWCYPLTGIFVFWQGYPTCLAVYWLPWLLLAVDKTIRRPSRIAGIGLSAVTCLVLISGNLDVVGQVLLVSGIYALWCLWDEYHGKRLGREARKAAGALVAAWGLGFLLATPHLLPLLEYAKTGYRMVQRAKGTEERPPVGLAALPQVVLPNMYGSREYGSFPNFPRWQANLPESTAATYCGVLATLLVAPLAWCSRRHRSMNIFWVCLGFLGLSWSLNVPGFVTLWRMPGLNMMSHNRLVFASSFTILALTAVGLEMHCQGRIEWRRWFWLPTGLLAMLCAWCVYRAAFLPEPVATQLELTIRQGKSLGWIENVEGVRLVQTWFVRAYTTGAVLCGLGAVGWLVLRMKKTWRPWVVPVLGILLLGDLLWFAYGRSTQCDPALYFPRIPVLEKIAKSPPGRVVGYGCLPATLPEMYGLGDIRGYDSVDPLRFMEFLARTADANSPVYEYVLTMWFLPRADISPPDVIKLSPLLDMLNVRYVIFRGTPPPEIHPTFQSDDYWALENRAALPRAFIPRRVEAVIDDRVRLEKLGSPQFDPREVAFVESSVDLPTLCRGSAEIVREIPTQITVFVQTETPGLIVLADRWDKGWSAYLNGKRVPILRTNHVLRGVVVPSGDTMLEFRYQPASFAIGLWLAGTAAVGLLSWVGWIASTRRHERRESTCHPA